MDQVPVKGVVVSEPQACTQPVTVMVKLQHTCLADRAVIAARRLPDLTSLAVSKIE